MTFIVFSSIQSNDLLAGQSGEMPRSKWQRKCTLSQTTFFFIGVCCKELLFSQQWSCWLCPGNAGCIQRVVVSICHRRVYGGPVTNDIGHQCQKWRPFRPNWGKGNCQQKINFGPIPWRNEQVGADDVHQQEYQYSLRAHHDDEGPFMMLRGHY